MKKQERFRRSQPPNDWPFICQVSVAPLAPVSAELPPFANRRFRHLPTTNHRASFTRCGASASDVQLLLLNLADAQPLNQRQLLGRERPTDVDISRQREANGRQAGAPLEGRQQLAARPLLGEAARLVSSGTVGRRSAPIGGDAAGR
jgi:hypothetical protein